MKRLVRGPHPALALDSVTVRLGGRAVLSDVAMILPSGSVSLVHGGNGSGKSTLLRVVAGLRRPNAGSVRRHGGVAYVPASPTLDDPCRVGTLLRRLGPHAVTSDNVRWWLRRLGAVDTWTRRCCDLSTGSAAKVLLANALAGDAALLVFDEPWAHLDVESALALDRALGEQALRGRAVLAADHSARRLPHAVVYQLYDAAVHQRPAEVIGRRAEAVLTFRTCHPSEKVRLSGDRRVVARAGDEVTVRLPEEEVTACLGEVLASGWTVMSLQPHRPG
jgi:ABC-type Mn2+/Zn2+ transport system ATPase subunit